MDETKQVRPVEAGRCFFCPPLTAFGYFPQFETLPQDGKVTTGLDVKEREPFEHVGGDEDDDYYSPKCAGFSSKILAKQ